VIKELEIKDIEVDIKYQARVAMSLDLIQEYQERIEQGDEFPAIELFEVENRYILVDGFHRLSAYKKLNQAKVKAKIVTKKSERDALLYTTTANSNNGLRRSREDIKKAIKTLLEDSEWSRWSERKIARVVKTTPYMVRVVKKMINFKEPDSIKFDRDGKEFETTLNSAKNRNKRRSIYQREAKVEADFEVTGELEDRGVDNDLKVKDRVNASDSVEILNLESEATKLLNIGLINLVIDSTKEIKNISESRESIITINTLGQVIPYDKIDIESRVIEFICKRVQRVKESEVKFELSYSNKRWFASYIDGNRVTQYSSRDKFEAIKMLANSIYELEIG